MTEVARRITTGMSGLDTLLEGLIPGDNVVWVADSADVITVIEDAFLGHAGRDGRSCSYVTAVTAPAALGKRLGPRVAIIDARPGRPSGDPVSLEREMLERAKVAPIHCTVVDNLTALAARWGDQKALAFFARTCPQLFNLGAVAYWRTFRGLLSGTFLEDVRRITQCVIDIAGDRLRVVKAEGRPDVVQGELVRFRLTEGVLTISPERALSRLGRGLQQVRRLHHLTQAALAQLAGITPSAVSQAETGRRGLSLDTLLVIADRLHVSLDDLLPTTPSMGYVVIRHDRLGGVAPIETVLVDNPSIGLRAVLIRLGPGQSGSPPWGHKGPELLLVASGLVQLEIGDDTPVVRAGDAALATLVPIDGWRNLLSKPASLFWILRDP